MPSEKQPQDVSSDGGGGGGGHEIDPEIIDMSIFGQILEMDDDPQEHDFSKTIVRDFFEQAKSTFESLDENIKKKELGRISELGHFLKGSSATLGLTKLQKHCEHIQNFGKRKDESGNIDEPDDSVSLMRCQASIAEAKKAYVVAERQLERYFQFG